MSDRHYFINCRGADFFPSYESVWEKSGHIPTITRNYFNGRTTSMNPDGLMYNGSTRISTWLHFNESEVSEQVKMLKTTGINLLRIHLDLYAWAGLGVEFLKRAKTMARIAQDNKMYIQWVLFEADTPDDIPGIDLKGRKHEIGGQDPNNLDEALAEGLHHYQRCPTVYNDHFLTRHPSSMEVSGNKYFEEVIGALSGFKSTLSWEVMSNVEFNSLVNPADVSAYHFVASAIDKANSLVPNNQKVTASFKKVKLDSPEVAPDQQYPVDLFLLIGDSLAEGTAYVAEATGVNSYWTNLWGYQTSCFVFQPSASRWSIEAPQQFANVPAVGSRSLTGVPRFEGFVTEENNSPTRGFRGVGFGYEVLFLRNMRDYYNRNVFIVKLAKGGAWPASGPVGTIMGGDMIFPNTYLDFDTYNAQFYPQVINWLTSAIDLLDSNYGKGRTVFRGGIISLGTNSPQVTGVESIDQCLTRVDANYKRLVTGIRGLLKSRKVGSDNSKFVAMIPDSRYQGTPYFSGIRNVVSGLSRWDSNIITYDPPSAIVNFIGTSRDPLQPDYTHYNSSATLYLASNIANFLKATPIEYNIPYKVSSIYDKLDFICYKGSNGGFIDRIVSYVDALSAAVTLSKPLMVVDATLASKLNHLHTEISSFSSLQVGFITDGIIDRNISNKPNNNSRGIFYSDGEVRDKRYSDALMIKAKSDLEKIGINFNSNKKLNSVLESKKEKTSYELNTLQSSNFDSNVMTRWSQFGTEGPEFWNYMKYLFYVLPELNTLDYNLNTLVQIYYAAKTYEPISTKYAPYGSNAYSKSLGYDISDKNLYLDKNDINLAQNSLLKIVLDVFFDTANPSFYFYSLNDSTRSVGPYGNLLAFSSLNFRNDRVGDYLRDKLCTFKINLLEQLQRALPVSAFNDNIDEQNYPSQIIPQAQINSLLNSYAPFSPLSRYKTTTSSIIPTVGNPKLLSGTQYLGYTDPNGLVAQYLKPFLTDLSACQKPACYYLRGPGYLSGACIYKANVNVDPNISSVQNVLEKLDWGAYDIYLENWYDQIMLCWAYVILNYPAYLNSLNSFINSSFTGKSSKPNLSGVI